MQYALPVYNFENISSVCNANIEFQINDQLFLETRLMEIRGSTISYSSHKKKCQINREQELMKQIEVIENNLNQDNEMLLINLQNELQLIREDKTKVNIIRSRAEWIENGEKPTFFCNLEKYNYTNKTIPFLETPDGNITYEQSIFFKEAE